MGWLRVDYGIAGAPPLPIEGATYVIRMPESGRLQTSSPYDSSIDNDQFTVPREGGDQKVESAQLRVARSEPTIEGYAVQNVFGFFTMVNGKIQKPGKCVFVGTAAQFRESDGDCKSWEYGQSEPPKFKQHFVFHKKEGGS
jgi:hypothetical protein